MREALPLLPHCCFLQVGFQPLPRKQGYYLVVFPNNLFSQKGRRVLLGRRGWIAAHLLDERDQLVAIHHVSLLHRVSFAPSSCPRGARWIGFVAASICSVNCCARVLVANLQDKPLPHNDPAAKAVACRVEDNFPFRGTRRAVPHCLVLDVVCNSRRTLAWTTPENSAIGKRNLPH